MRLISKLCFAVMVTALGQVSCKSDSSDGSTRTATAAVVAGAQDSHCGTNVVTVSTAACKGGGGDAGADAGAGTPDYGDTMFNADGDDDDCKYRVKWTAASGAGGTVNFTVTLSNKSGNTPVTGAPIDVEAFLDETHPAPNSGQTSKETSTPGTYTVGPVAFDTSGKWTVRFHIHDECDDSDESPHGHAAFFMQVDVK